MFKKKGEEQVEEEILSMVEEGQDQGFIHEEEAELISNILIISLILMIRMPTIS